MVIGNNLCGGFGIGKNITGSISWLEKAASQDNAYANYVLARAYLNGLGIPKNISLGLAYLEKSVQLGDVRAKTQLAAYKFLGDKVDIKIIVDPNYQTIIYDNKIPA